MNAPTTRLSTAPARSSQPSSPIRNNRSANKNKKHLLLSLNCILIVTITSSVLWTIISSITTHRFHYDYEPLYQYQDQNHRLINQQQQHHSYLVMNNPSSANTNCDTTSSSITKRRTTEEEEATTSTKTPPVAENNNIKKESLPHDYENIPSRVWKKKFQTEFPCYDDGNEKKLMKVTPPPNGRGLLFHRPHKVGSTTMVGIVLRLVHSKRPSSWFQNQNDKNKTTDDVPVRCLHRANHGTALSYQYGQRDHTKSYLFSLVRHPTNRIISEYFHFRVSVGHYEPTDTDFMRYVRQPKYLNYYLDYFRTRNNYNQHYIFNRTNNNYNDELPLWERFCKDKNITPEEFHTIINNNNSSSRKKKKPITKVEKDFENMLRDGWKSYQKKHANDKPTQFELWERFCREMMVLPEEFQWVMNGNNHSLTTTGETAAATALVMDGERARILRDEWTEYQKYGPPTGSNSGSMTTITTTNSQHYTIVNDILHDYDFIGVTERMNESLVVLQMLLNLTTHDILYTKARTSGAWSNGPGPDRQCIYIVKSFLSPTMYQHFYKLKEWERRIQGDSLLYRAVNASLDRTIDNLGRTEFDAKLRALQEGLLLAEKHCSQNGRIRAMCTDGGAFIPVENRTCYIWGEGCDHDCIDELKNM